MKNEELEKMTAKEIDELRSRAYKIQTKKEREEKTKILVVCDGYLNYGGFYPKEVEAIKKCFCKMVDDHLKNIDYKSFSIETYNCPPEDLEEFIKMGEEYRI